MTRRVVPALAAALLAATAAITVALPATAAAAASLQPVSNFGANPGALALYEYVPDGLPAGAPVVVAMHGCTQSAADYHANSGWREIADRGGFAVLYPQQSTGNNYNKCFNWFEPGDSDRGKGEAASIRTMVQYAIDTHGSDASRVYVTGLSAGGAMTTNLLADYPEVFAGGAVSSGIAAKCGTTLSSGVMCMSQDQRLTPAQWAQKVKSSAPDHTGPWPTVAIFHGTSDYTVNVLNARQIRDQWTAVHGIGQDPTSTEQLPASTTKTTYANGDGKAVVEQYLISGMGHAQAVDPGSGAQNCGTVGQYYKDTICAGYYAATSWGLL